MVLIASGRETRGPGPARAAVTGTLTGPDGATTVSVRTDPAVTGRPAQFGRGVPAEVGDWPIGRFARCLAERLGEAETRPGRTSRRLLRTAAEPFRPAQEPDGVPLDLLRTIGVPVAKRAAPGTGGGRRRVVATTRIRRMWTRRV
jgi:hypothetical protein